MFSSLVTHFLSVWPIILAADLLRYLLAAGSMVACLVIFRRALAGRRLQTQRPQGTGVPREIGWSLVTVLIFSIVGYSIALGARTSTLNIYGGALPGVGVLIVEFALIVVAHDTWFYWLHRLLHLPRLFRISHRIHHLSRSPTPWAAYAFAPLEALLEALFLPVFLLFVETHSVVVFAFTSHMILRNVVGHAGTEVFPARWLDLPVLRWVTTTTHHDQHHAHSRGNYGLYFRFWDRLMGTERADYEARFREAVAKTPPGQRPSARTARRNSALLVVLVMLAVSPVAGAGESAPAGLWATAGFSAIVEVTAGTTDGDPFKATVRWVWDGSRQDVVGKSLFVGMYRAGNVWSGGRVLDPENGKRYRATVRQIGPDRLRVRGCIGPFCREQEWRRLDAVLAGLPRQ